MGSGEGLQPPPGRNVLLVDDEPGILVAYSRVLTSAGYAVTVSPAGSEALEQVRATTFDAVVSDVNMPGLTGLEFLRKVREVDLDIPVLLMTSDPDVATAAEAIEYGAFRYLFKPVSADKLSDAVHAATSIRRLSQLKREALEIVGRDGRWLGDRAALEARFAKALEGLFVVFQPIVSWPRREVYGYEALARSTEETLKTPRDLFDAAERLGRLEELGRALRARVTAEARRAPGRVQLFVNLHPEDLNDFELYSSSAPLSSIAKSIVLEVTERATLDRVSGLQSRIAKLRKLGFRIAVDDLGAGYAGLSCFTQLEPDIVKLDVSLVRGVDASPRKRSVVRSMLELAGRDLNMLVVCEGVETVAERDALAGVGADLLQGYLFARPNRGFPAPRF